MSREPRTILITGASSGIGRATALQAHLRGHRVLAVGRDRAALEAVRALTRDVSSRFAVHAAHPADWSAIGTAVRYATDRFGGLDAVVANAGFSSGSDVLTSDPELDREMVLVNLLGPALLAKASAAALRVSGGRLVIIGSVAGVRHLPASLYGATKFGVAALAENLRMSLAPEGVGVVHVVPGYVDTPFHAAAPAVALQADDVAHVVLTAIEQPSAIDLTTVAVRPRGQVP